VLVVGHATYSPISTREPFDLGAAGRELFLDTFVTPIEVIDPINNCLPVRDPANTSETEARRSVAITGAPVSRLTPRTIAEPP
jgi:hypothetical protein